MIVSNILIAVIGIVAAASGIYGAWWVNRRLDLSPMSNQGQGGRYMAIWVRIFVILIVFLTISQSFRVIAYLVPR